MFAKRCESFDEVTTGCAKEPGAFMGNEAYNFFNKVRGIFNLKTRAKAPFGFY